MFLTVIRMYIKSSGIKGHIFQDSTAFSVKGKSWESFECDFPDAYFFYFRQEILIKRRRQKKSDSFVI